MLCPTSTNRSEDKLVARLFQQLDPLPLHCADEQVATLYARRVAWMSLILGAVAYLGLFVLWSSVPIFAAPDQAPGLAPLVAVLVGSGGAVLLRRYPRVGSTWLLLSLAATLYHLPVVVAATMGPALVCAAILLAGRIVGGLTGLAIAVIPGIGALALLGLALTVLAGWLSVDYICAALNQASAREARFSRVQDELLTRRGELRRLNDSLRNAYTLLERTNRELANARDEAEEARRLKNQFAASISHELRTPLNLILGFTEVMHTAPESYGPAALPADLRGDIREVYTSARHLLDLVDDVLDLSRIDQVQLAVVPEPTDLKALIEESTATVSGLFRAKPVSLEVAVPDDLPAAGVDRTRIRQVLINLLTNAARFTDSGVVRVSAGYDRQRHEVVMSVSDTGPGIPEADRERLFQPFYQAGTSATRQKGGSGLGLHICRTFVNLHGGRIWVEANPGGGTKFSFALPIRPTSRMARPERQMAPSPEAGLVPVLVLDATGDARRLLGLLPNLEVHGVASLHELAQAAGSIHPRAVVACANRSGELTANAILEAAPWPGLPVITLSPSGSRPLDSFANVRAVLTKPVSQVAILSTLDFLGATGRVVLADDDPGMTRLLQRTLERERPGLSVFVGRDGNEALDLMYRHRPHAAMIDLAMPGRDGLSVLEEMAAGELRTIPVIVVTAMDLASPDGRVVADALDIRAAGGLTQADALRYVDAILQAARPRYASAVAEESAGLGPASVLRGQ